MKFKGFFYNYRFLKDFTGTVRVYIDPRILSIVVMSFNVSRLQRCKKWCCKKKSLKFSVTFTL